MDNVIRIWLSFTVEDQRVAHDGLGETDGRCLGVFYTNYGMARSQDADLLQHSMNVLVCLFQHYGLADNISKLCMMTFQPDALRSGVSEEAEVLKCMGVEDLYQVKLLRSIPCLECGF